MDIESFNALVRALQEVDPNIEHKNNSSQGTKVTSKEQLYALGLPRASKAV